ncbi:protein phosphatase [Tindallia magadiensis]|uniref:Protein phosphatase n=1 Tax=Tindallia magadiensis TaxID=69895 RepID=A0A1I3AM95_9FIRM|nr:Stp1/IreP family PP2C-type Ser/Thr phosphatase [Tindallia magadiensis]SFH51140.1 protein phosphatase [Tindallia magadiensis]
MDIGVLTDIGKVRVENQDAYHIYKDEYCLFMVADGMGGHSCGKMASNLALQVASSHAVEFLFNDADDSVVTGILYEAFHRANQKLLEYAVDYPECAGMGTTLTMVWTKNNRGVIGHIGDSRAYLLRNNELMQMTEDHSLVAELYRKGEISKQEALYHPQKHVITRAMGIDKNVRADFIPFKIMDHDILVLCTDGVTNLISDDELRNILLEMKSASQAAQLLIDTANNRGGHDNSTVLIAKPFKSSKKGRCSF